MAATLDGVPVDELATNSYGPSLAQQVARARGLGSAGPSTLLALSARASTSSLAQTRTLLRSVFGFSKERATLALDQANRFDLGASASDALSFILGSPVSVQDLEALLRLFSAETAADGASCRRLCFDAVERAWQAGKTESIARAAATSRDAPSQVVAAALLATMRSPREGVADRLTGALQRPFSTGSGVKTVSTADRVLAAAYALDAKRSNGLDLGGASWNGAPAPWRYSAAPWVLPILEPARPAAVAELLAALRAQRFGFAQPAEARLPKVTKQGIESARNMAVSAAPHLTRWFDRPMFIDLSGDQGPQIVLTQDDEYAYAWVGRSGRGVLVAFDTQHFNGYGLDEQDCEYALAAAIGWYIDVSVALRATPSSTSSVRRQSALRAATYRYVPTPTYTNHFKSVAAGTTNPPRPHMVAAFIRTLPTQQTPNKTHVAQAPPRLRQRMGRQDTYVRSHKRGLGAVVDWPARLSRHSALADVLGVLARS